MNKFYTYAHTKPDGSIFYIGKGHDYRALDTRKRNPYWKNVVAKHGGFNSEILAYWDTEQEAFDHEVLLISCFKDMGYKLANLTNGGEGPSGYKFTEEQRKNLSEAMKKIPSNTLGKKLSKKTCEKMSKSRTGNKQAKRIPLTICGKTFECIRDFILFVNLPSTTVHRWIKNNKQNKLEQAYLNRCNHS